MAKQTDRVARLQTSAMENEDLSDRTAAAARRWIRAHESLMAAIEQTFDYAALAPAGRAIYDRRVRDSRDHVAYWREVLAEVEA